MPTPGAGQPPIACVEGKNPWPEPCPCPSGLPLIPRDDTGPRRLHASPRPLRVQPARRARADHRPRRRGGARTGFDSLAITDHGALYGAVAFYQAAQGQGHQADHRRRDLRRPAIDDRQGGQGRRPALPPDPAGHGPRPATRTCAGSSPTRTSTATTTSRASTGSTSPSTARASSGCRPASAARSPGRSRSTTGSWPATVAGEYGDILGKDRFFLELQDHGLPEQTPAQRAAAPPRARRPACRSSSTNDLHYVRQDQAEAHDVLLCVGHRQQPRHAEPDEVRDARVLPQVRRGDGGALPGPARGARSTPGASPR